MNEKKGISERRPRCSDCKWWCGKRSSIGRECMNPELQWKWKSSVYTSGVTWQVSARYKAGCQRACKVHFEPKGDGKE